MTLTVDQVTRIQIEVMSGASWEQRSAQVPSTDEAREMWTGIAHELTDMETSGVKPDVLHDIPADDQPR